MREDTILREHLVDHVVQFNDPHTTLLRGSYESIREILEEDLDNRTIDVFALVTRLSDYGERHVNGSELYSNDVLTQLDRPALNHALEELAGRALVEIFLGTGPPLSCHAAIEFFRTMPVAPTYWELGLPGFP